MDVGAADAAALDEDVDVIVLKGLGVELMQRLEIDTSRGWETDIFLLEIGPVLLRLDHEALKGVGIAHGG